MLFALIDTYAREKIKNLLAPPSHSNLDKPERERERKNNTMPPHRRDASLYLAALALFAAALRSLALAAETTNSRGTTQAAPSAAASAAADSGGGGGASGDALGGRLLSSSSFAPPWASAFASVSSVTASAACSLFGREASAAARDSRLGLATAAACGERERR